MRTGDTEVEPIAEVRRERPVIGLRKGQRRPLGKAGEEGVKTVLAEGTLGEESGAWKTSECLQPVVEAEAEVEVELEVLRIPPNPRLVICRYWVSGEERRCMVRVRRNSNFVPGMKFWLPEPNDPVARAKPWAYSGLLPRRRGRW